MIREPERLAQLISAVRTRWFMTVALRNAGIATGAAALPVIAAAAVYWLIAPTGTVLLVLAGLTTIVVLGAVALVIRRIERRPDDRRVARFIEERVSGTTCGPPMDDCVVSAVQASTIPPGDDRAAFATLVIGAALRRLEAIDASTVVPSASIRRAAATGAGGAGLLLAAIIVGLPGLTHSYETARLRLFPGSV